MPLIVATANQIQFDCPSCREQELDSVHAVDRTNLIFRQDTEGQGFVHLPVCPECGAFSVLGVVSLGDEKGIHVRRCACF